MNYDQTNTKRILGAYEQIGITIEIEIRNSRTLPQVW